MTLRSTVSLLALLAALPAAAQTTPRPKPLAHAATQARPQPAAAASLPIRRVALYKNGVGFFEHAGQVHGDDHVTIDFTTAQLNDVLQTLTAVDLGGGRIAGAGYNSTTPVEQQLRSLPLSLGADPTSADFYSAIRGARVEVTGAGAAITGRILNVELRTTAATKEDDNGSVAIERHFLTVVSDAGEVRTVELNTKTGVRLLDPSLHSDVNRYLQILSDNHRDGLRHLTLADNGTGTREVRVSYISEVPVWKSTYRILFDSGAKAGAKQATLQGWAVVDNTVGADWNNVQLSLIAGAPQSFIQPISQPYYNRRPEIGLPKEAQLEPQTHESGDDKAPQPVAVVDAFTGGSLGKGSGGGIGSGRGNGAVAGSASQSVEVSEEAVQNLPLNGRSYSNLAQVRAGAAAAAPAAIAYEDSAAASLAANTTTNGFDDFFEYKLTEPVTIAKNGSALVPILQTKIDVDPVTLFTVGQNAALRALWIKNTSTLTLDRGSFSILEGGNFSGQGLLEPIHPGERRLLSYAADTAVRVTPDGMPVHNSRRVQQITIAKGILTEKTREVAESTYLVHNAAGETRTVIVETPHRQGWELDSDPKPEESTAAVYRFRVIAQPGESVRLHVGQRHTLSTRYALVSTSHDQIELLLRQDGDPANVRAALEPVFQAKQHLADIDTQLNAARNESNAIATDQNRLRQNLTALKGSVEERALVKRYTDELNKQEDRLAELKTTIAKLQAERDAANADMATKVEALNLTVDIP